MKRVAIALGVSVTTVSKVLNNRGDIGPGTRARVLAKVEELGYQRNVLARNLSLRRTHTLGVVVPELMHSFFAEIVAGIEPIASASGYGVLLCNSNEDARKERADLQLLRGRQVDGVVLAAARASNNGDVLLQLTRGGTGLVMIDRDDHPEIPCHRVLTDDVRVGRLATSHLLDLGHRAIAHIGGPPLAHARRRLRGWRDALRARGVRPAGVWLERTGFMEIDGYRAMKRLLGVRPRIDAVFAVNDPVAIGALKAIWEAGLRVPRDVAVVGAGDIKLGDLLRVPLTTVSWSREEVGRHAATLLLAHLADPSQTRTRRVIVEPRLVVRESCGASPGGQCCDR
jgi:LacI family transcriptional regulator